MAWSWTKSWSSADDGSTFGGADIENIQTDISNQACDLTSAQTVSGVKTFSGNIVISGNPTISGTLTISGNPTISGDATFSGAVTLPATGVVIGTANQGDIFYDDGTDIARLTPGTSGYFLQSQGAAANPQWAAASSLSNVIFCFCGCHDTGVSWGFTTDEGTSVSTAGWFVDGGTYKTILLTKHKKMANADTVTFYGYCKALNGDTAVELNVDIGGQSGTASTTGTHTTVQWVTNTVDISSLTTDTVYDVAIQMRNNNASNYCLLYSVIGITS